MQVPERAALVGPIVEVLGREDVPMRLVADCAAAATHTAGGDWWREAVLLIEGLYPDTTDRYAPAQKWLKDRQGRTLTYDEMCHYQRLLAALQGTERLMREWDAAPAA